MEENDESELNALAAEHLEESSDKVSHGHD